MENNFTVLQALYATLLERKKASPTSSYVASLFAKGTDKIAQKIGEEAVETVIAATSNNREAIVSESADLLFHLMVLWAHADIFPQEIMTELKRREGVSGLIEKQQRKDAEL